MAVPNAPTDIVNLALDVIKTENINNVVIPSGDKTAVIANRWYDILRRDALEGFPWNFASTRGAIPLSGTDPLFGFDDSYVLPDTYLSLNFIKYWDHPLSRWNYQIENGKVYIDQGGATSLQIGYVFDQTVITKWSPSFKIYVAYCLAEKIAFKLTGNVSLVKRIIEAKKIEQLNAKAKNGKANPPVAFRQSRMLQGRRIFGGSRTSGLFSGQNGRT